jgi:4-hydroxy 2-oxovalerate aldolase
MKKIAIHDPTLRDGNHAVAHQLSAKQIDLYTKAAEKAGVPVVEVGHGNGLGASSLQVGEALESDVTLLETARKNLKNSKLSIHCIPGFATIKREHLIVQKQTSLNVILLFVERKEKTLMVF